jgi:hypothetical protein
MVAMLAKALTRSGSATCGGSSKGISNCKRCALPIASGSAFLPTLMQQTAPANATSSVDYDCIHTQQ